MALGTDQMTITTGDVFLPEIWLNRLALSIVFDKKSLANSSMIEL